MKARTEAREQAFILLFEYDFNRDLTIDQIIQLAADCEVFETDEFAQALAGCVFDHRQECDSMIGSYLKPGWRLERLTRVALAVLRIAVTELCYFDETPVSVVINEAVELTKKYSGQQDAAFVNGVLGQISRNESIRKEAQPE